MFWDILIEAVLKEHDLRFIHAKFQSTGSSGLVSTWYWNLTRFPLKTTFFSILSCRNCTNFLKMEHRRQYWPRTLDILSILYNLNFFWIFEKILAKNKIFSNSKFAQACLGLFSLKKVWWLNHLNQCYEILREKNCKSCSFRQF